MKKRMLALILSFLMLFACACAQPDDAAQETAAQTDTESSVELKSENPVFACDGVLDPVRSQEITDALRPLCTPVFTLDGSSNHPITAETVNPGEIGLYMPYGGITGGTLKRDDAPAERTFPQLNDHVYTYSATAFRKARTGTDKPGRYMSEFDIYSYLVDDVEEWVYISRDTNQIISYTHIDAGTAKYNKSTGYTADNLSEADAKESAYTWMDKLLDADARSRYTFLNTEITPMGFCCVNFGLYINGVLTDDHVYFELDRNADLHAFGGEMAKAYEPFREVLTAEALEQTRQEILNQASAVPDFDQMSHTCSNGLLTVSTDGVVWMSMAITVTDTAGKQSQFTLFSPVRSAALVFPNT